jgi:rhodanese-related sulfurtransferase
MNRRMLVAALMLAPAMALAQPANPRPASPSPVTPRPTLSVREAHERAKAGRAILVDIRTPEEWRDTGVAEGAVRLDMLHPAFEARLAALRAENPGRPIALICRTGSRTRRLQEMLTARGWQSLVDVRGGMLGDGANKGWLDEGLPLGR